MDSLHWTISEKTSGKGVKVHKLPKDHEVKVFRVVSFGCTDYVVTNDLSQSNISATQQACGSRWQAEHFRREAKHLTGLEKCQCRLQRIVRTILVLRFSSRFI